MGKPKSEVLTIKIKLKVKFPRAAITRIRTLPTVFLKLFRTAVWRKIRDDCLWHYVCSMKVALTVFTEMCPASFFTEIKMLLWSKKFNGNCQRKYCSRKFVHHESKMKLDHWKKTRSLVTFLRLLKFWKLKKISITA